MFRIKFSVLVLLIAFIVGSLLGCKADEILPEERTKITFAYPGYLTAFNEANYQELADAFNKQNPDLWVELREVTWQELDETNTDYLSLITNEDWGVDVFLSRGFLSLLTSDNVLPVGNLEAVNPEIELDDFYPLALEMMTHNGVLQGIPAELDLMVMYYNKDLFDQAGVPYPAVGWTRDDFLATADALRKALPERKIAFGGQVDEVIPFIYAHGGRIRDEQGDFTLTDPLTVEAVQWYTNLALVHEVMPLPAQTEAYQPEEKPGRVIVSSTTGDGEVPEAQMRWSLLGSTAFTAAQEGDVAFWVNNFSIRQGVGGWDWDFDWGIVSWPQDRQQTIIGYPLAYFVAANTPEPEAALRWVDFLSRQPPQLKGLPARISVAESSRESFVDELGAVTYDALLRMLVEGMPIEYYLYYVSENYLGQAMLDILENGIEVGAALSEAQAELEAEQ